MTFAQEGFIGLTAAANLNTRQQWLTKSGVLQGGTGGNNVSPNNASADTVYAFDGIWGDDQIAESTVTLSGGGIPSIGPAVRVSSAGSGYAWVVNEAGTGFLNKYVSGVFSGPSLFTSSVGAITSGSVLRISVSGNLIRVYNNGVLLTSVVDSSFTSGNPGLVGFSNSALLLVTSWFASDGNNQINISKKTRQKKIVGYGNDVFGLQKTTSVSWFSSSFSFPDSNIVSVTIIPTGGITFSGSASLIKSKVYFPTGNITFSATNSLVKSKNIYPTGNITFSGTASYIFSNGVTSVTITPSGGITFSGTNILLKTKIFVPTGNISFSGSTSLIKGKIFISTGVLQFSGTNLFIKTKNIIPTGVIQFSGTAPYIFTSNGIGNSGITTRLPLTGAGQT